MNSKTFKWRLAFQNQPRLLYLAGMFAASSRSPCPFIFSPRHLMKSAATYTERSSVMTGVKVHQLALIFAAAVCDYSQQNGIQDWDLQKIADGGVNICVTATFSAELAEKCCMTLSSACNSSALTSLVPKFSTTPRSASLPPPLPARSVSLPWNRPLPCDWPAAHS